MEGCQHPHDDPLVIRVVVAHKVVHKVLVDNGSSADIIFASSFDKMGIGREKLASVNAHLWGFSGERVLPLESIQLVFTLGDPPCQATTTVRFLIVDAPSAYNILLGRLSLNAIRAIPSAYHMVIKFPTANGVGMVRVGQTFPQCHKSHPFRLSYGYQIPHCEWGRNGSRRSTHSQGVLLDIYSNLSIQHFSYMLFTKHTNSHNTYNTESRNNNQNAQRMHDLARAHQVLSNRIPNFLILSYNTSI